MCLNEIFGAANAIRTRDLVLTKDVLYHLSHSSGFGFYCVQFRATLIIIADRA